MPNIAAAIVLDLAEVFDKKLSGRRLELYANGLADLPLDQVGAAAEAIARTSDFFPSLAQIRAATVERMLTLPTEDEALAQVEARAAWARESEYARGKPPDIHPLVRIALTHVGGAHAFRNASEPTVLRGQFLRLYREMRANAVRDVQVDARAALPPAD